MYCTVCVSSLRDQDSGRVTKGSETVYFPHHRTRLSLQASVASGCVVCSHAWQTAIAGEASRPDVVGKNRAPAHRYSAYEGEGVKEQVDKFLGAGFTSVASVVRLTLTIFIGESEARRSLCQVRSVEFRLREVTEATARGYAAGPSTWSSGSKQKSNRWMDECRSKHISCAKGRSDGWVPTRLVDISSSSHGFVRVVDTEKEGIQGDFGTLSHCWGPNPRFLMLTKSTSPQLHDGVPVESLSKTFQEAIEVCRDLGLRYIWIDSLCILQGDRDEWLYECSRMELVYANSSLNIAAAASLDGSGGLFRDRSQASCPIDGWLELQQPSPKRVHAFAGEDAWRDLVGSCPLYDRGWVFQERLLAPRILLFGDRQLLWECREMSAAEYDDDPSTAAADLDMMKSNFSLVHTPRPAGDPHQPRFNQKSKPYLSHSPLIPQPADQALDPYRSWALLVHEYSRMSLTRESDRLIALSGVAKVFSSRLGDEYVAGMWRRSLESDLMWTTMKLRSRTLDTDIRDSREYRAPTFSWASANRRVILDPDPDRAAAGIQFEILDLVLEYANAEHTTGAVTGGHIDIRARVRPCRIREMTAGYLSGRMYVVVEDCLDGPKYEDWAEPHVHLDRDLKVHESGSTRTSPVNESNDISDEDSGDDSDDDDASERSDDGGSRAFTESDATASDGDDAGSEESELEVDEDRMIGKTFFFFVASLSRSTNLHRDPPFTYSTAWCILLDVVDAARGVYRRIGTFRAADRRDGEVEAATNWIANYKRPEDGVVPSRSQHGDGEYTIRII